MLNSNVVESRELITVALNWYDMNALERWLKSVPMDILDGVRRRNGGKQEELLEEVRSQSATDQTTNGCTPDFPIDCVDEKRKGRKQEELLEEVRSQSVTEQTTNGYTPDFPMDCVDEKSNGREEEAVRNGSAIFKIGNVGVSKMESTNKARNEERGEMVEEGTTPLCSRTVIDLTGDKVVRKRKAVDDVEVRTSKPERRGYVADDICLGSMALFGVADSISDGRSCERHFVERTYVWGGEADVYDVVEIKKMLSNGFGVYGHRNCKLEVNNSLLENAGRGVFLKQGCILNHGECLTEYSGQIIRTTKGCSRDEQLRTVEVGDLKILGNKVLKWGDGFGSLLNSSVASRTISFARFVTYDKRVFIMVHNMKNQYPLRGYIELYITVGQGWWSLFHSNAEC